MCGCGVVAAVTLILLVCFSVYVNIAHVFLLSIIIAIFVFCYFRAKFIHKTMHVIFCTNNIIILIIIVLLLQKCAAFCKMSHISRVTPPTLIKPSLSLFDDSIHHCFTECLALNLSSQSSGWKQAGLSLSRGGLGLRSVAVHSTAAYLGSISYLPQIWCPAIM